MNNRNRRPLSRWENALFLAPLLVLSLVWLTSRLETLHIPRQKIIERGQPLFTMEIRWGSPLQSEDVEIVHAVRTFNGTYKIYWTQKAGRID